MPRGSESRVAALETAAARLAHAMHESQAPVDRMGAALERMMRTLAHHARALERLRTERGSAEAGAAGASLDDLEQCRDALEREIAICIESLQFHDRLMQQLAQVRGGLAALTGRPHGVAGELRAPDSNQGSVELF